MALCCLDDFKPEYQCWWDSVAIGRWPSPSTAFTRRADRVPVHTPDEVDSMFDASPTKRRQPAPYARAVLGTQRFRTASAGTLLLNGYGNTETTDLWTRSKRPQRTSDTRAHGLVDLPGGHPLVTASADGSEVLLTQEPFSYLPAANRAARKCGRLSPLSGLESMVNWRPVRCWQVGEGLLSHSTSEPSALADGCPP